MARRIHLRTRLQSGILLGQAVAAHLGQRSPITVNRRRIALEFRLAARAGPEIPLSESRKNCHLIVDLTFPQGWSFTVANARFRGSARLDRLVSSTQRSAYFFQGDAPAAAFETHFIGPLTEDYNIRDSLPIESLVWSPCRGRWALNINTEVRVNNLRNPPGKGVVRSSANNSTYNFLWRRCD